MDGLIELLAPVGSREALTAAVESGANAVYLAGTMFGARAYASNFDNEELREAIAFAHQRNVLVHVAVNTLVDESEFEALKSYLRFLYEAGADAIIVQDLGAAKLARAIVPDLPLHASTQMTIHNLEGALCMERLGFSRAVLARELSLEEIQTICAGTKLEIEVFVHGALCISYSGQCLMSSMIGGRSGNRGRCAQPCRLPYTLVDEKGCDVLASLDGVDVGAYLLSPRDLNGIDLLPRLIEVGVMSFKIEGRMKRPEYVAIVTDAYRRAIDGYLQSDAYTASGADRKSLAQIFNRDFTAAYLEGTRGRHMMSDRRPNNRGVLIGRIASYDAGRRTIDIRLQEDLYVGDIVEIWVKVGGRVSATVAEILVGGKSVISARAGEVARIAVPSAVRDNDRVFKVFDAPLMERARAFFNTGAPVRRFDADLTVMAEEGRPLRVEITDEDGYYSVGETDFIVEKAKKRPLTEETIWKQMDRLGTTVFRLRNLTCHIVGEVMAPVSEMNEARRKAVEALLAARGAAFVRTPLVHSEAFDHCGQGAARQVRAGKPDLAVSVDTVERAILAAENGADLVIFGGDRYGRKPIGENEYRKSFVEVKARGGKIAFQTPRIMNERQFAAMRELWSGLRDLEAAGFYVHSPAALTILRTLIPTASLWADLSMNVYNSAAIDLLREWGAAGVTLSPELNMAQTEKLAGRSSLPVECIVHGHLELMISEYCMLGSFVGGMSAEHTCTAPCAKGGYALKDRKDELFPIVTDPFCRMHVLNGKELSMLPHTDKFGAMGAARIRVEGKFGNLAHVKEVVRLYRALLDGQNGEAAERAIARLEGPQITRGHYFRGVL